MERLDFGSNTSYRGLEAAIHLARYALAYNFCKGRRVLDIACGEGYGSRFLREWGAKEVEGVDVSAEAVETATRLFGTDGLNYSVGNAEHADQLFNGREFDLILSIETIEHLQNPVAYLMALQRMRAPGSVVIITCPNDWWYFPTDAESNPYHVRKYTFSEFMSLAETVLGKPSQVAIGTAVAGFVNVPLNTRDSDREGGQLRMMESKEHKNTFVVPCDAITKPSTENCSYFVAIWGASEADNLGAAMLPVTMDIFRNGMYAASNTSDAKVAEVERKLKELSVEKERQLREMRIRQAALQVENDVLRHNCEMLRIEARRYRLLRGVVPVSVLSAGRFILSLIRKRRKTR